MSADARNAFTQEDKQLLAEFLSKIPAHKRAALGTFKEFAKRYPHHSDQSWHTHYRKTGREDIDRRIERIKRQRQREKEDAKKRAAEPPQASGSNGVAQRDGKGKGKAVAREDEEADAEEEEEEVEEDQLDEENVVVDDLPPNASSSKARPTSAGPSPKPAEAPPKKKRSRSPISSSDDSSADERSYRKKPKKRVAFDDDDFETLVIMLDKAHRNEWTRQRMYQKLEQECPAHTAASWQTYHSNNRAAADKALKKLRKGLKRKAEEKKAEKSKPATIDMDVDEDEATVDEDEKERRRRDKGKGKARDVESQPRNGQGRLSQASFNSAPSKRPASRPAADEPSSASSSDAGAKSAAAKIKSSSKGRSSTTASPQKVATNGQVEPPFTEEDDARLVQHLASGMMNNRDQAFVWKELARVQPAHPASSWQARFSSDMSGFLLRVTDKIRIAEKARQRKAELEEEKRAAEAEEAWRREEEEAERRKKRDEEARQAEMRAEQERIARETEEQERLDREAEEQERLEREAEEEERLRREAEAAAAAKRKAEMQGWREKQVETEGQAARDHKTVNTPAVAERVKLATPRPSPPGSATRPARAVEAAEHAAGLGLATAAQGAVEAAASAHVDEAPAASNQQPSAALEETLDHAEVYQEQLESVPSSLALPRLSQYSVMPSPFLQGDEGREYDYVEEDEDDRDLDRELARQIKAEEEELGLAGEPQAYTEAELAVCIDEALGETGDSDYSDDDEAPVWNQLDAAEAGFIEDLHAQVAMLQQGFTAPRLNDQEPGPRERETGPAVAPEVGQLQETVVVEETVETVEEAKIEQPPSPPARQPFAFPPSPQLPRAQQPVGHSLSDALAPGSTAEHGMRGSGKKLQRLPSPSAVNQELVQPRRLPAAPLSGPLQGAAEATPTTRRRIPRASLAASTPSVAGSPAPAAAPASTQLAAAPVQPARSTPAPVAAPAPPASSARDRPPLKEVLESIAADYHLSFNRVRNLFYCFSALNDFTTFREIASFFSEPFKPDEGSVEYTQAKRAVERYLWSMREDEIVLEGTEAARKRIEEKKGKGAVARRRQFLNKARVKQVSDLARDRYSA
ncbi:hypothetical protein NBRC10512_002610 [Rhodotorula toruloides]|uniref:RHTO0S15e05182g1_1 n=2 Tax=Rhodotorula toruloides TaxID=5286 RepID=A0A061BLU8_RHOTO|nr:Homeodomain-like protein [Rhodotorula toruloides NP11]EMS25348.1 Homeodomain-like protein [Rhodotorula toruloides NP11]CDR48023.1 RHTO0S15e05182g1_1 [Rhodotorula toruloides]